MFDFWFVAIMLLLLAGVFLIFPVLFHRGGDFKNRSQVNIVLFKERLGELTSDLSAGTINQQEFSALKGELEKRLLEDTAQANDTSRYAHDHPGLKVLFMWAALVPVLAFFVYQQTGAKPDLDIKDTLHAVRLEMAARQGQAPNFDVESSEKVTLLIEQLEQRLKQKPKDFNYLMLLASTYMRVENFSAAADIYQQLSLEAPSDASILGRYAQALFLASNKVLTPQVRAAAQRALTVDPKQSAVLGLLGIASFENKDYTNAIHYWQRLLPLLTPGSPNHQMINRGIEQAHIRAGQIDSKAADTQEVRDKKVVGPHLLVRVSLADHIHADSDAAVFVFARAVNGPPMPLAVARLQVGDLPATVTLDDSMAMMPALKLSNFPRVEVVARISKNGIANRGPGDIEGILTPIDQATAQNPINVSISTLVP